jgi:hypothetical protein
MEKRWLLDRFVAFVSMLGRLNIREEQGRVVSGV